MGAAARPIDPLTELDWGEHWRRLVEARAAGTEPRPDYWDRRAAIYSFSLAGEPEPFLEFLEPFLAPGKSLIDVGAGTGRHVVPLAAHVEWVTAVEPSEGMRARIPHLDNVTVVGTTWQDAEVAPADLVICSHVLYPIGDAATFVSKMEASARERVFIYLRDAQLHHPAELLWDQLSGGRRPRQPQFYDAYNLLHWMGIEADVAVLPGRSRQRFQSMDDAVLDCRVRLGALYEEAPVREWLQENLKDEAGTLVYEGPAFSSGVAHWRPRSRN